MAMALRRARSPWASLGAGGKETDIEGLALGAKRGRRPEDCTPTPSEAVGLQRRWPGHRGECGHGVLTLSAKQRAPLHVFERDSDVLQVILGRTDNFGETGEVRGDLGSVPGSARGARRPGEMFGREAISEPRQAGNIDCFNEIDHSVFTAGRGGRRRRGWREKASGLSFFPSWAGGPERSHPPLYFARKERSSWTAGKAGIS